MDSILIKSDFGRRLVSKVLTSFIKKKVALTDGSIAINNLSIASDEECINDDESYDFIRVHVDADIIISKDNLDSLLEQYL